ncbi:MAG: DUF2249 domain-containing protein [Burkholderiales bacterium]|nr:DUF2249 domain-containing protein [Burkholderiales bacterium]
MSGARVIDARGLPPPQPFELVMEALCDLAPGEEIVLVLEREPTPLYQVLERNGYVWTTTHHDDGERVEVRIRERRAR